MPIQEEDIDRPSPSGPPTHRHVSPVSGVSSEQLLHLTQRHKHPTPPYRQMNTIISTAADTAPLPPPSQVPQWLSVPTCYGTIDVAWVQGARCHILKELKIQNPVAPGHCTSQTHIWRLGTGNQSRGECAADAQILHPSPSHFTVSLDALAARSRGASTHPLLQMVQDVTIKGKSQQQNAACQQPSSKHYSCTVLRALPLIAGAFASWAPCPFLAAIRSGYSLAYLTVPHGRHHALHTGPAVLPPTSKETCHDITSAHTSPVGWASQRVSS